MNALFALAEERTHRRAEVVGNRKNFAKRPLALAAQPATEARGIDPDRISNGLDCDALLPHQETNARTNLSINSLTHAHELPPVVLISEQKPRSGDVRHILNAPGKTRDVARLSTTSLPLGIGARGVTQQGSEVTLAQSSRPPGLPQAIRQTPLRNTVRHASQYDRLPQNSPAEEASPQAEPAGVQAPAAANDSAAGATTDDTAVTVSAFGGEAPVVASSAPGASPSLVGADADL